MSTYRVEVTATAQRQLAKLDGSNRARILRKIDKLSGNPRPGSATQLVVDSSVWRLRIGDYRAFYAIDEVAMIVTVSVVAHRSRMYEDFL